jgi:signal transduction histidine kinase
MTTSPLPASPASESIPILLVDDQPSNLEALEAMLESTGCRLVRAQSADEALLALLNQDFAAIVLDIRMPGTNGLELAEFIKQRKRTQHVPILFLTAHLVDERDVLRGYLTGAADYLTKPIRPEILRSKVAVFVELFRKSRALAVTNEALQREVAERQRAEEALRRVNQDLEGRVRERTEALEVADRRKDEFLAALAHELRNPLAPIRAAVEFMRLKGNVDPALERARGVIDRQVEHMTRLIDDLLDVSRITRDQLVLRTAPVQLGDIVAAAVETSRPAIDQRGHRLTIAVPPQTIWLEADPARLSQVLSNLLTNAAKYTPPCGDITISAEVVSDDVIVHVIDTGVGIASDMLPRIFEMFIQVDRLRGRSADGLGIGLTLARRLVEMHGGTIEVASSGLGHGSRFSIRLPVLDAGQRHADRFDSEFDPTPLPDALRVLVVDDNRDAAEMLVAMLTAWGQRTAIAFDGPSAIEVGQAFRPNVVLLDIGMPNMDGHETARRMRQQAWGERAVLAAVTGWGQQADRERSEAAGFDHHLVKPVAPAALKALLSETAGAAGGMMPSSRPVGPEQSSL